MSVQSQGGGLMIYLLEDEEGIRNFVIYALGRSGIEAEGFGAPSELYAAMEEKLPRLLLLDRMLPEEDGISVLRKLRAREDTRKLPVIMLTAKGMEVDSGADDYITKPFKLGELCSRIRALLRRARVSKSEKNTSMECGDIIIDLLDSRATLKGKALDLTSAEYRLLCLLVRNANRVVTRDIILNELWDDTGNFVDDNTLSVYVRRLREKVETDPSHPEHLITIRGFGYQWKEVSI